MRSLALATLALVALAGAMAFEVTDANAIVCARGVYRAGCAGVVHRPVGACRWVVVNGVRVRRCV